MSNLIRHPRFKEYFDQEDYREPLEIPSPINERLRLQFHITLYGNREHLMLVATSPASTSWSRCARISWPTSPTSCARR